jgi:hypothetical protein
MKRNIKHLILGVFVGLFYLSSCQVEVVEITNPQNDSVLKKESPVVDLVQDATMKDGSFDNILDHSSCISVVLPVTVFANGQEILIETEDDLKLIERIFDESDTDEDILEIVYPITVILADHTEVTVNNDDELASLAADCIEGGMDDDIECIDFAYPLSIAVYDTDNQVSDIITIENDEQLYNFFDSMEEGDLVSFIFPLTLILKDGTEVVVNDNQELEDVIKSVADDCDEDDDNDYNDDDIDDTNLISELIDGNWIITHFVDGMTNGTENFQGFIFTFFEDGTAKSINGDLVFEGTWQSYGDDGSLELVLDFGSESPMDVLGEDWNIMEFDHNLIKLGDGGDDEHDGETVLVFERPADNGGSDPATLSQIIIEGHWLVANYNKAGDNKTANYDGFELTFADDNTVVAAKDMDKVEGGWAEITGDEVHKLELDFGTTVPFDEFNNDWDVVSFTENRIELKDINSDTGAENILVFERL